MQVAECVGYILPCYVNGHFVRILISTYTVIAQNSKNNFSRGVYLYVMHICLAYKMAAFCIHFWLRSICLGSISTDIDRGICSKLLLVSSILIDYATRDNNMAVKTFLESIAKLFFTYKTWSLCVQRVY